MNCFVGAYSTEWDLSWWACVPVETTFWVCHCEANWVMLYCRLKSASMCVGSGASWEGLPCRPRSATTYDFPALPGRSYKAVCGWLLSVLDLEANGRGQAENWCWLPPVPDLGQLSKRTRALWCLMPHAACLVIFNLLPDIMDYTLLGAGYFHKTIHIF